MRVLSADERQVLLKISSIAGVEVGLFEVTATQLEKSIIDANYSIQQAFLRTGYHDYGLQPQGTDHKVSQRVAVKTRAGLEESTLSLYRPPTKAGDPRFWVSRLGQIHPHLRPPDLAAVVQDGKNCLVASLSDLARTGADLSDVETYFGLAPSRATSVAVELLAKLRALALHGPLPAVRSGDASVGMSVEAALGITPNPSRTPDYQGIELKSGRSLEDGKNKTLLAMVPKWKLSPVSSYADLLHAHGYLKEDGLRYLQCSVDGVRPNPQGLSLSVDLTSGHLIETFTADGVTTPILYWELDKFAKRLAKKHAETFWIEAVSVDGGFQLNRVVHTTSPRISSLALFLTDGTIFVDHTIREKADGGTRDHGMLFRIKARDLRQLFIVEGNYDL